MKILFCLLAFVFTLQSARAQSMPDWNYLVAEEMQLSDANALAELLTQWKPFVKEHSPDSADWLYLTDDEQRGYFLSMVDDFSQIQKNREVFMEAVAKYRASGLPDLTQHWMDSHRSTTRQIARFRSDLSFVNEDVNLLETKFRKIIAVHLLRDQEQAWQEAMIKLNELDKAMNIRTSRYVWEVAFGADLPLYWVAIPADNTTDFYTAMDARMRQRQGASQGAEWFKTYEAMKETSRSVDQRNLTLNRELSFVRALDN